MLTLTDILHTSDAGATWKKQPRPGYQNLYAGGFFEASRVAADSTFEYEVLLYEGQPKCEIIYGTVTERGFSATIGVQEGTGSHYTQHSCKTQSIQAGTKLTFDRRTCLSP